MQREIYVLKLVSGDEVIGEVVGENDKGIDLNDALMVKYRLDEKGYPTLYFTKYCLLDREFQVFFKRDTILNIFRYPTQDVCNYYQSSLNKIKKAMSVDYEYEPSKKESTIDEYDEDTLLAMFERLSSNTTIQ